MLLAEGVLVLNQTGATILGLCDGERTVVEIVEELRGKYNRVDGDEVRNFLARLVANGWWSLAMDRPYGMLAELTYACPLHCRTAPTPLNLTDYREELSTAECGQVLTEARSSASCSFTSQAVSRSSAATL